MKPMVISMETQQPKLKIQSEIPPEAFDKPSLYSPKSTIGMHLALDAQGIIGSFLFESTEKTIRVNQRR